MPGGTIRFANGLGTLALSRGAAGLVLDVVPASIIRTSAPPPSPAPATRTRSTSATTRLQVGARSMSRRPTCRPDRPVRARVGPAHAGGLHRRDRQRHARHAAADAADGDTSAAAMNVYWIVQGGTLTATTAGGDTSLGATAPAYFAAGQPATHRPAAPRRHRGLGRRHPGLGRHAGLPARQRLRRPGGRQRRRLQPQRVHPQQGRHAHHSYAPLVLGYQYTPAVGPVQNYGLPITVRSDPSTTPVNLGGTMTLHSGIQMTSTGSVDLNVPPAPTSPSPTTSPASVTRRSAA